jgi:DNA-binding NarL/FixJ family response regulator
MAGSQHTTRKPRRAVAGHEHAEIGVFLCDDATTLRDLLRTFLEWDADIAVVGEADDGDGLVDAVRASAADVILLDLSMPNVDGLEALVALRAAEPDVGIVVLSGFDRDTMAERTIALGADEYLEKTCAMEVVRTTVRDVAERRRTRPVQALDIHEDVVQGLTAISWALEAGAYEEARAATQATLAHAQTIIGDLLSAGDVVPGALRRPYNP